ncbi:MAG: hypothetical protein RLZZ435_809 [Cyanobacteriota bacterium]|jgi:hypothetical protein
MVGCAAKGNGSPKVKAEVPTGGSSVFKARFSSPALAIELRPRAEKLKAATKADEIVKE